MTPMDSSSLSLMDVSMNDVPIDEFESNVQEDFFKEEMSVPKESEKETTFFNPESTMLQKYILDKTYNHFSPSVSSKLACIASPMREHSQMENSDNSENGEHNASSETFDSPKISIGSMGEYATITNLPELQLYRQKVTKVLESLIANFLREKVESLRFLHEDECCKMLTFGSCRLGVDSWNSDIDLVAVVPHHVSRDIFFGDLRHHLELNPHTSSMNAVTDAFVPVLKFLFQGVPIDLLHAAVNVDKIDSGINILQPKFIN